MGSLNEAELGRSLSTEAELEREAGLCTLWKDVHEHVTCACDVGPLMCSSRPDSWSDAGLWGSVWRQDLEAGGGQIL